MKKKTSIEVKDKKVLSTGSQRPRESLSQEHVTVSSLSKDLGGSHSLSPSLGDHVALVDSVSSLDPLGDLSPVVSSALEGHLSIDFHSVDLLDELSELVVEGSASGFPGGNPAA